MAGLQLTRFDIGPKVELSGAELKLISEGVQAACKKVSFRLPMALFIS
jgi:hypothetical protein